MLLLFSLGKPQVSCQAQHIFLSHPTYVRGRPWSNIKWCKCIQSYKAHRSWPSAQCTYALTGRKNGRLLFISPAAKYQLVIKITSTPYISFQSLIDWWKRLITCGLHTEWVRHPGRWGLWPCWWRQFPILRHHFWLAWCICGWLERNTRERWQGRFLKRTLKAKQLFYTES